MRKLLFVSLLLLNFLSIQSQVITDGLLAYWPLDGNGQDISGNGHHSIDIFNVTPVSNRFGEEGKACYFIGNSHMLFGDILDMGTSDMSFTCWFRFTSNYTDPRYLMSKTKYKYRTDPTAYLIGMEGKKPGVAFDSEYIFSNQEVSSGANAPWYFLAVIFDRDSHCSIYLNDKLILEEDISRSMGINLENDISFTIGAQGAGSGAKFIGAIDEVGVYNRVLTISEVEAIFTGQIEDDPSFGYQAPVLSNENYVFTRRYRRGMTNSTAIEYQKDVIESIAYFDGLGRPMQQVGINQGSGQEDIITHIGYDAYGRQDKEYLPYASNSGTAGSYRSSGVQVALENYYHSRYGEDFSGMSNNTSQVDGLPVYSEKHLESSPLSRVLEQGAPGKSWQVNKSSDSDHTIKFDYQANTAGDGVKLYRVDLSGALPVLVLNSNESYPAGRLYKTVTKDENWKVSDGTRHTTEEFTDKQGRVVLKRTYGDSDSNGNGSLSSDEQNIAHDTYYVYDDYGNLSFVLPPKAQGSSGLPSQSVLTRLCYQYRYDDRNRLIEKQLPGKGREYIVYNKLDQPVMTQDGIQDSNGQWLFTKYDAFGRVAYTGIKNDTNTRDGLQNLANDTTKYKQFEHRIGSPSNYGSTNPTLVDYSNEAIPGGITQVYTVNYYDDYDYGNSISLSVPSQNGYGETIVGAPLTKGLATASKVRVLDTNQWIEQVSGYNSRGDLIWTKSYNAYLGTTQTVDYKVSFSGEIEQSKTTHQRGGNSIVVEDFFEYDHTGRPTLHTQKINGGASELIAENSYDALGQLIGKGVGNTSGNALQDIDYTYNIRGWLTGINDIGSLDKLFNFKIVYDDPTSAGDALYNGNISQTHWRTDNTDTSTKTYTYAYDDLNRIRSGALTSTIASQNSRYDLSSVLYDQNGNITRLVRKGAINSGATSFGNMDVLSYAYESQGNKLLNVTDTGNTNYGFTGNHTGNDYSYDANGNMTRDENKRIQSGGITYNHLNLPKEIRINGSTNNRIEYIYDATGIKLAKKVTESGSLTTTEYAGGFVYRKHGTQASVLDFFSTPEGYVSHENGSYQYVYQYKDHLGNVRLSYSDANHNGSINPDTELKEEHNYYPFGMRQEGYNTTPDINLGSDIADNYLYNGVELEESLELNLYEMEMRQYDPAIARWKSIDPVTHYNYSTYTAFDNNPVFWADPSGADGEHYNWNTGRYEDDEGNEVSFNEALSNSGFEVTLPPTQFVTESGEEIANTNDGSDDVYVVRNKNVDNFLEELKRNISNKEDLDSKKNTELGQKYGFNIDNILEEYNLNVYAEDADFQMGYYCGHDGGLGLCIGSITAMGDGKGGGKTSFGIEIGKDHKERGVMNVFEPSIFNGKNFDIKVTPVGPLKWKYSEKPIPLLIEEF